MDIPLVEKLVRMVTSKYVDGKPPHWQEGASRTTLGDTTSTIFVVDLRDFLKMTDMEIKEVYRYRHILVTGIQPGRVIKFDEDGLEILADLDDEVSIQRMSLPPSLYSVYLIVCIARFQPKKQAQVSGNDTAWHTAGSAVLRPIRYTSGSQRA